MKRLTTILALGCIIAMSLTACLKNDDNDESNGLTPAQITQCFNALRGEYSGQMIYPVYMQSVNDYDTDTVDIDFTVATDTTLTIHELPAKVVAGTVNDEDLRTAMVEQNPINRVKCLMGFYNLNTFVEFYLGPQKVDYPIFYKNQTRTLSVYFWVNTTSFGFKELTSGLVAGQIVMGAIYLDNDNSKNYLLTGSTPSVPLIFATDISKATSATK